jgi:hypothetical protein
MSCFVFIPSSFSCLALILAINLIITSQKHQIKKKWARNGLTLNISYVCNQGRETLYCSNTPKKTHIEIMHVIAMTMVVATSFVTICLTMTMKI